MQRKSFLAAGAAAVAAGSAVRPARAADPFRLIITETDIPLVPNSVEWLALSMGYFKRAGVDVELIKVQQTPSAVAALHAGQGEMANIGIDVALQLIGRGQIQAHGVCSPDKSLPFVIAGKKAINSVKDLAGKTFGVARVGSVDYDQSRLVLSKLGVNPDSLKYLAIGQPAVRAQALLAGQIDATTMSVGVYTTIADKSGLKVLVNQDAYFKGAPIVTKINIVPDDVAKARRKDVQAVVRGIVAASRDFSKHPMIWVNAMSSLRPDLKIADLVDLSVAYRDSWSVNGGLNLAQLKFTTDTLYKGPDFADLKRIDPPAWIDTSYADAVIKSLGGVDKSGDDPGR
jgi:NitT/TauT family transport system substrate-binding protein